MLTARGGGTRATWIVVGVVVLLTGAALVGLNSSEPTEDARLRHAPPTLQDPITIEISEANAGLKLEPDLDYILEMPETPLEVRDGLRVRGGHNVVLIGGEIHHPEWYDADSANANRGLLLADQTGVVHVEGLLISGAVSEGIDLSEPDAEAVQLQNIRVETVVGSRDRNHADIVQSWAGPRHLRIDKLSGTTTYQGLFLLPGQHAPVRDAKVQLDRVDIHGLDGSGYLFWVDSDGTRVDIGDVWATTDEDADRSQVLWWDGNPDSDPWEGVAVGRPPQGPYVPPGAAGTGYESPGYR